MKFKFGFDAFLTSGLFRSDWILASGAWVDDGFWRDDQIWKDAA